MALKNLHIGDMHGKWDKFFNKDFTPKYNINDYNKIIFIGDYWDSFDVDFETQRKTFNAIIELKKQYPDRFVLLLGNHDVHYLYLDTYYRGNGFQEKYATPIHTYMIDNAHLFDYFYMYENVFCSHAGLTSLFLNEIEEKYDLKINDLLDVKIRNEIKEMFFYTKQNGGFDPFDGPLWCRPNKINNHPPSENIVQVFGHTYNCNMEVRMQHNCMYFNIDCDQNLVKIIGGNFEIID